MRVACVSLYAFASYTILLANELCSRGLTVKLILPEATSNKQGIDSRIEVYLFKQETCNFPQFGRKSISICRDIFRQIDRFKPDVIHTQATHFWISLPLLLLRQYPLVTTFHDVKPHLGEEKLSSRLMMYCMRKRSSMMLVHGEQLKQIMIREFRVPADIVTVIPFGEHYDSPLNEYLREDVPEEGNLVLFFGRIYAYKGLEHLIQAEPLISKEVPGTRIVIAGEGEDFQKYRDMMVNPDSFIVHNYYVSPEEGAELFQRCSVVALPYVEASQSGVAAMAYGFKRPVVVTNVGSIPELVDNGKTGFIVPPGNPEALAHSIVRLLKDKNLRREMGENAYRKLKTDMSWEKISETTIDVYKEAIGSY